MTYFKESIITKLQKLYSLPRNFRAGNKLPALFLKKRSCTGDLSPTWKIFIKRPAGETKWFKEENFDDMVCKAQQQTLGLPSSARLQSADTSFGWEHYVTDVFEKFLSAFIEQSDVAFEQIEFWMGSADIPICFATI